MITVIQLSVNIAQPLGVVVGQKNAIRKDSNMNWDQYRIRNGYSEALNRK